MNMLLLVEKVQVGTASKCFALFHNTPHSFFPGTVLCEQNKQYLASQEDSSVVSSNPAVVNGEVGGSKGDRKPPPTGEWDLHSSGLIPVASDLV